VQDAYRRQYGAPIASIYQRSPTLPSDSAGAGGTCPAAGVAAALLDLFALTLTERSAPASWRCRSPWPASARCRAFLLMIVLGLVNVVTNHRRGRRRRRAAERCGYGSGFMGRMVREYLGGSPALCSSVAVALLASLTLPVLYIGFGSAMAASPVCPPRSGVIGSS